jgi:hypothetical protein
MRKFILAAVAAAGVLTAVSVANAAILVPVCGWVITPFGLSYVCY